MQKYYNKKYFNWQSRVGEFGGRANLSKFASFIKPNYRVIDYGCGGGYLLKNIVCKEKIGIEINNSARAKAKKNIGKVVASAKYIPNNWADVVISNHVLEHTQNPLSELRALYPRLKKGGLIIFYVPCDTYKYSYDPEDVNHHLFSWSPMNLGNIFKAAGYKIISVSPQLYKWPKHYELIERIFGMRVFQTLSWIKGHFVDDHWSQVRIIATK